MKKLFFTLMFIFALLGRQGVAHGIQRQMAIWTFDGAPTFAHGVPISPTTKYVTGSPTLTMYYQDIDSNGKVGIDYTDTEGVPHLASRAAAWDDIKGSGNDAELELAINTTGWMNLAIRFDYKSESAGSFDLEYSIDGGTNWLKLLNDAPLVSGYTWQSIKVKESGKDEKDEIDLSHVAALDHKTSVIIKISDLDKVGNGKFAFDNFEVRGEKPVLILNSSNPPYINPPLVSGVNDDTTDPGATLGINLTSNVNLTGVTVISSDDECVPNDETHLIISGADKAWNLKIIPNGVCYDIPITVNVEDGDGNQGAKTIRYSASAASVTHELSRFHTGASDASTAIAVDENYMFVGNEEDQVIRLYDRGHSGLPVNNQFDFTDNLGLTDMEDGVPREVTIEASTRAGNRIYWIGSHGNSSRILDSSGGVIKPGGKCRPNRNRIFATDISGSGDSTTLSYRGRYDHLREDLINWDNNDDHKKGAQYYGLEASAACHQPGGSGGIWPQRPDGFKVEGLAMAPDSDTVAYVAFRAPIVPKTNRGEALIVPVNNFTSLIDISGGGGTSGSADFGEPIELNLNRRGIRNIARNSNNEYLIIAGPAGSAHDFHLYTWTGQPGDEPELHSADLTALNAAPGSFESIVSLPESIDKATTIQVLLDNGTTDWYNNNEQSKKLPASFQKSRSDIVALGGPVCELNGPAEAMVNNEYPFKILCDSDIAQLTWVTDDQDDIQSEPPGKVDVVRYTWTTYGPKTISVTVESAQGYVATFTHTVKAGPCEVTGPDAVLIDQENSFTTTCTEISTPVTFTWEVSDQSDVTNSNGLSDTVSYSWNTYGDKSIEVTANSSDGEFIVHHSVNVTFRMDIDLIDNEIDGVKQCPDLASTKLIKLTLSPTKENYNYEIHYINSLLNDLWLIAHVIPGVDGSTEWIDCGGPGRNPDLITQLFYRGAVQLDSDGDGLSDYYEEVVLGGPDGGYDPNISDTDGDGISDADEDPDGDGLTNLQELLGSKTPLESFATAGLQGTSSAWTDPLDDDTDDDGYNDIDDDFPLDPAAWFDNDGDGKPDQPVEGSISSPSLVEDEKYSLTIAQRGTGSGMVTVNGETWSGFPVINCITDCTETYYDNTEITLTAITDSGSIFEGWSGADCGGASECTVTLSDNKAVTAYFNAESADPNEPNDIFAMATSVSCPIHETTDTRIDPMGDVDFYKFTAEAGDMVEIDVDARSLGSGLDSMLGLFDSSGTLLALSDNAYAPGETLFGPIDSFILFEVTQNDTYYIGVTSAEDSDFDGGIDAESEGPYTLSISCTIPRSFRVDSIVDAADADPGDGECATAAGECTLRGAIEETNARPGPDNIEIPEGTYVLTIDADEDDGEINASTGDLDITDHLTIIGEGSEDTIIDANGIDRVFHINVGASVKFEGLTLKNGLLEEDTWGFGGGIFSLGSGLTINKTIIYGNSAYAGGGIAAFIDGPLKISDSSISDNTAVATGGGIEYFDPAYESSAIIAHSTINGNTSFGGGGAGWGGGGISNQSTMIIDSNTIFNNEAPNGNGGGILNSYGQLTVNNSTISDNTALGGAGIFQNFITNEGITIKNSTISRNVAEEDGGGIMNQPPIFGGGGWIDIVNTLVADNTAPTGNDCRGSITSLGNNLIGNPVDCNINFQASDLSGDSGLGDFVESVIPGMSYFPLLADSQAIDAGNDGACPDTDQLGNPRVDYLADEPICDIGAIEFQGDSGFTAYIDLNSQEGDSNHPYVLKIEPDYGNPEVPIDPTTNWALKDFDTGFDLPVTMQVEMDVRYPTNNGADSAAGTDADQLFGDIVDGVGGYEIDIGDPDDPRDDDYVRVTFNNLNPEKEYVVAVTYNRDGGTNYTNRVTRFAISGADTYTNASTTGVVVNPEGSVASFSTGNNTGTGYVAQWTGVIAFDGSFSISAVQNDSRPEWQGRKAYAMTSIMLEQVVPFNRHFIATSSSDAPDANPGDGVCDTGSGECTLRAAVEETNALPGANKIFLPGGTHRLSNGALNITDDLTIIGAGNTEETTIIDGGGRDRVIHAVADNVTLEGIVIKNGSADEGGGILNQQAELTITNCTISHNHARLGAGIFNNGGAVIIQNSTIEFNTASQDGGGIFEDGSGSRITNTTIAFNTAFQHGGGICFDSSETYIDHSTISENSGGNISFVAGGGIVELQNSILGAQSEGCGSPNQIISLGNNVICLPFNCSISRHSDDIWKDCSFGFTAYNDLAWAPDQLDQNITKCTSLNGESGLPNSDELVDSSTGNGTGVWLEVTGGSFNGSSHATEHSGSPDEGDAYDVFDGILDAMGSISYNSEDLELTFSGMDPDKTYTLVFYGHRNKYGWDRASLVTISGADDFTNQSSNADDNPRDDCGDGSGRIFCGPGDDSTRLPADNDNGYVARFTGIDPGGDGEVVLTIGWDGTPGSEDKGKYANAVMLKEEPPFTAYNDLAWAPDQLDQNITKCTSLNGESGLPNSDELVDSNTGNGTGVWLEVTGGSFNGSSHATEHSASPDEGDAYDVFNGKLDAMGSISYNSEDLELTFSGMDPYKTYTLVFYGHRNKYGWDRASLVTISGAEGFTNQSSNADDNPRDDCGDGSGRIFCGLGDDSTRLPADNDNGYVARFTGIDPGGDGEVVLTISWDGTLGSEDKGKYANAVMLMEEPQ